MDLREVEQTSPADRSVTEEASVVLATGRARRWRQGLGSVAVGDEGEEASLEEVGEDTTTASERKPSEDFTSEDEAEVQGSDEEAVEGFRISAVPRTEDFLSTRTAGPVTERRRARR